MAKILLYTLVFSPDQVSNAYILADMVEELSRLGHEITVLTTTPHYHLRPEALEAQPLSPFLGKSVLKSDFHGVPCYHVRVPEKKGKILQRIVTSFLFHVRSLRFGRSKYLDFDCVVTVSTPPTMGIMGPRIARKRGAKTVFVVWDLMSENFLSDGRTERSLSVRLLRWFEKRSFRENDAVVSLAPTPVSLIRSASPEGKRVEEIPTSVNEKLFYPQPRSNDFSARHGWDGKFVVSYVGNLGKYQDFSVLPEAVRRTRDSDVEYIVAGAGLKYDELRKQAENIGHWKVWGHQSRETAALINASSDLCLVLLDRSATRGSFPSKLYTIMACGRPVLYYGPCETDIGRLIRETRIGWTVETGDVDGFVQALRQARDDGERLQRMGQNALDAVRERYSARAVALRYHELIEELTNRDG